MELIVGLIFCVAIIGGLFFLWVQIFQKAGYEFDRAVLMAIGMQFPLLNLVLLIYFVSTPWPIHTELTSLREKLGIRPKDNSIARKNLNLRKAFLEILAKANLKPLSVERAFFIKRANEVFGPYTREQFLELEANEKIFPETPVSTSPNGPWKLVEELRTEVKQSH